MSSQYYRSDFSLIALASSLMVFVAKTGRALAQQSVEEVRNSYNFLQVGLSTLAAATSVALCLARGRLDSETGMADFFSFTRFKPQNDYGAIISTVGNNGHILGITVSDCNPNVIKWASHNTWAQGSCTTIVPFWFPPPPTLNHNQGDAYCKCWHIRSITANGGGRVPASMQDAVRIDPQCYRIPSYQCDLHGYAHMPDLHRCVLAVGNVPLNSNILDGPSKLYQLMLEDSEDPQTKACAYFLGVDKLGARALTQMVAEGLVTSDASEKGRTSDLVDWSLGRLSLSEKPDVKWIGKATTVVLVGLLEAILLLLLCCVFGLDPFVSALGARRGVRSLRLGPGGVTNFADLWLTEVKGFEVEGWKTPILRVRPRAGLGLSYYVDTGLKVASLGMAFLFWAATVFGYVHPLGLERSQAWASSGRWAIFVASGGAFVGFLSASVPIRTMSKLFPAQRRDQGWSMVGYSGAQSILELVLTLSRLRPGFIGNLWLRRSWYIVLECGVWLQWFAGKRCLSTGPHSDSSGVPWEWTAIQAGALFRSTIIAAISGSWNRNA